MTMEPLADFLKPEECAEVDIALLSSKEKFGTGRDLCFEGAHQADRWEDSEDRLLR